MLTEDEIRELEDRKEAARQKLKIIYPVLKGLKEKVCRLEEKYAKNYVRFAEADEALSLNKFSSNRKRVIEIKKKKLKEQFDIDKIINGISEEEAIEIIQQILERKSKPTVY